MIQSLSHALTGIHTHLDQLERTAARIAREGVHGELAANLIDLRVALRGVQVNAASVRALDDTVGTLLDVLG